LNYLRLSSRIDAVAARLESAIRMKQVTGAMAGIVTGMDTALKDMDVEKVGTRGRRGYSRHLSARAYIHA